MSSTSSPSEWSQWTLDPQRNCPVRYRMYANGEYEYDYDRERFDREQNTQSIPRTSHSTSLGTISESGSYSASRHYTIDQAVNDVSDSLAQTSLTSSNHVKTSDPSTTAETFDPNYKVHRSRDFKWGRVLKVLWSEPGGIGRNSIGGTESIRQGPFGQNYYHKVRRFLIVKESQGHCLCLPIMTYGQQGTKKHGVHPSHHAIIYTDQPRLLQGEDPVRAMKQPVKVIPNGPQHKLDSASRLNYAKVYTVEHNVKVWFIGHLAKESGVHVAAGYNEENPHISCPSDLPAGGTNNTVSYTQGSSSFTGYSAPSQSTGNYGTGTENNYSQGYALPAQSSTSYQTRPVYGWTQPQPYTSSSNHSDVQQPYEQPSDQSQQSWQLTSNQTSSQYLSNGQNFTYAQHGSYQSSQNQYSTDSTAHGSQDSSNYGTFN
ncbi:hypothetical protein ACMFMG_011175 [Clarireedia jacksonii]